MNNPRQLLAVNPDLWPLVKRLEDKNRRRKSNSYSLISDVYKKICSPYNATSKYTWGYTPWAFYIKSINRESAFYDIFMKLDRAIPQFLIEPSSILLYFPEMDKSQVNEDLTLDVHSHRIQIKNGFFVVSRWMSDWYKLKSFDRIVVD